MGYVERHSTGRRTGTLLAVALLHGAVGLGIATAFAGGKMIDTIVKWHPGPLIAPDPKPTPTVEPTHSAERQPVQTESFAPRQPIHFDGGSTITTISIPTGPLVLPPPNGPVDLGPPATPTPPAGFMPRAPRPLGKPGLWVTNNDYPSGALRRGEQGVTGFSVTVGADGRVRDCTVTRSSGSAELDQATCAKVTARARFAPATDSSGDTVSGSYGNSIRWEIPQ